MDNNQIKTKIPIYKSEIETIRAVQDPNVERLLFVILVWSKTNQYNTTPCEDRKIALLAGLNWWKKRVGEELTQYTSEDSFTKGYLLQIRYIKIRGQSKPFYYVLFANNNHNQRPLFVVDSLETCVDEYIKRFDMSRKGVCCDCGKEITITSNSRKYCSECSRERVLQQNREYVRRKRAVEKDNSKSV